MEATIWRVLIVCWAIFSTIYTQQMNNNIPVDKRKDRLLEWLIGQPESTRDYAEQNGFDGFYNNPFQYDLGAVDTPLLRRSAAQYADGVSKPNGRGRPNPFIISKTLMTGTSGTTSKTGKTALLVYFGQQLVDELVDTRKPTCPPEYLDIPIPESHPYRNETGLDQLPLHRTRFDVETGNGPNNPRQQLNGVTPFIDGNVIYGTGSVWTDALRHFANGSLAPGGQLAWSDRQGRFPELNTVGLPMANPPPPSQHDSFKQLGQTLPASRHFMLGNPRGHENPALLSFGILWFRWHNYIARHLAEVHSHEWTDDRIFHESRKWVIATYQHIVINHWVPQWIGEELPAYKGYDASVNPQIDQLFSVAAMRFGHTLVPSGIYLRDYGRNGCKPIPTRMNRNESAIRLCNSYWSPQDVLMDSSDGGQQMDIDPILMGMASQLSEREDHMIVEDLQGYVHGPLEFPRRDLMAINIQRGRDQGVPHYNAARKSVGLDPVKSFDTFINQTRTGVNPEVIQRFARLYENATIDDVDVWVGGLMETDTGPGQLFRAILKDQFSRIRSADRYWYANLDNKLFTLDEVDRLEQLTLYDVIMAVTNMDEGDLQGNPFLSPSEDVPGQKLSPVCMDQLIHTDCVNQDGTSFQCRSLPQPNATQLTPCTPASSYSYFSGSEVSFVTTAITECLVVIVVGAVVVIMFQQKQKEVQDKNKKIWKDRISKRSLQGKASWFSEFSGHEWIGFKEGTRMVNILFNSDAKTVEVRDASMELVRAIDLSRGKPFYLLLSTNGHIAVLKLPKEYDLVLKCDNQKQRDRFVKNWKKFLEEARLVTQPEGDEMPEKQLLSNAVTARIRKKRLQKFFRSVLSQALSLSHVKEEPSAERSNAKASLNEGIELTKEEFANELRMSSDAAFVNKMFELVDKDQNGSISFREFLDLMVIFHHGSAEDKLEFIFNIYDTERDGRMTISEFTTMIRSLLNLSKAKIDEAEMTATVKSMISSANLQNPAIVTLAEFQNMMGQQRGTLEGLRLAFNNAGSEEPVELRRHHGAANRYQLARQTIMDIYKDNNESQSAGVSRKNSQQAEEVTATRTAEFDDTNLEAEPRVSSTSSNFRERMETWSRRLDYWRLEAFWLTLFTLFVLAVFAERVYTYRFEREHVGFRQVTGWGVPMTRGAASGMMLSFSVVLLTTCRYVTTYLRETPVHHYVPFDSIFSLHQYAAWWGIFFAVVHTVGHGFNFYHISTQSPSTLACLFREHFFPSHVLPKYHNWVFTATGITGVLLWIQTVVIFFFSLPAVRRRLFVAFWVTHNSYPIFYTLLLLHGASRLVQEPHFPYYLIGPAIVFTINFLVSLSRRRVQVSVMDAQLLPSDVTKLVIQRPVDFKFRSGQWIRLSCPTLGDDVYHPFTLSSSPQDDNLSVHIRAVGPWTRRMRETIQQAIQNSSPLPKLFMDGPYGEGHQEWRKYPVIVLIGAGIGVTPFSSILQDIASRISASNPRQPFRCKKVYFLWVTRDQKQFEWMVDLLREVEAKDSRGLISPHVFITQFYNKFDIRTVMLYVCERNFHKIEGRSLFTGLRAVTHFGHPNFYSILKNVGNIHDDVEKIGVFSCGPHSLSRTVDSACRTVNGETPIDFRHHYEIY